MICMHITVCPFFSIVNGSAHPMNETAPMVVEQGEEGTPHGEEAAVRIGSETVIGHDGSTKISSDIELQPSAGAGAGTGTGPEGPAGPAGPAGPPGPVGPEGPPGSAVEAQGMSYCEYHDCTKPCMAIACNQVVPGILLQVVIRHRLLQFACKLKLSY